jgi:signal transduction histidine kinase/ActR/RegA family two-component response regulator
MDLQTRSFGIPRFAAAWIRGIRNADFGGLERAFDVFLALACLSIAIVICCSLFRRHDAVTAIAARRRAGLLGGFLIVCGLMQLEAAVAGLQVNRASVISLLSGAAAWAAALYLRPPSTPTPLAGDVQDYQREIAGRRRAEAALRNFEAQTRKLAELDTRKNEFLAMLGHELRNPLAPIRNAVKIMKQRGSDDPDMRWARDVIDHQVRQMGHLVDDLLEISRVTSGKVRLHKEPVDVATIVAFAVETSRPGIEAEHHHLSITLPPRPVYVDADSIRMAQVLSNLLGNAAKYTARGGLIRLSALEEGSEVVFRVRDNGIGIPPDMLTRIFDLFTQVDHSLDHSQGGIGLGLSVVRSLVEMHGGSVEARSEGQNRGSEFLVRLPIMTEPQAQREAATHTTLPVRTRRVPPDQSPKRILVVDDNVTSAQSLAMVLKFEGHDVRVAYDGELALETVGSFRPHVVLMDIGLPGRDGYEVARQLRADPDLSGGIALLVAVTGYAEDDARRSSREAGFDHHLVKPLDPEEVLSLLSSLEWDGPPERTEPPCVPCEEPASLGSTSCETGLGRA